MRIRKRVWLLFLLCGNVFLSSALAQTIIGLQPGVKAPEISLSDQTGKPQNLGTLTGPNGLLLLFFRSADWCPFCKGQLVDLERAQKLFAAKGIHVAGVSYDSPQVLAEFSRRKSVTYPLLSDKGSIILRLLCALRAGPAGRPSGAPEPAARAAPAGTPDRPRRRLLPAGGVSRRPAAAAPAAPPRAARAPPVTQHRATLSPSTGKVGPSRGPISPGGNRRDSR